jgi:hypothetical protein
MSTAFSFFLRLFLCFVVARFFLQAIGVEGRNYLVGLTIVLLGNVYWFSYLVFRDRTASLVEANGTKPRSPVDAVPTVAEPQKNHAPPEA